MSPASHRPETAAAPVRLIRHGPLALRLRRRLGALAALLDGHSFWATGRSRSQLGRMLSGSQVVVSAWRGKELVGFGRATSDGVFRAVLWDVVVAEAQQGRGLGRRLVEELLASPAVAGGRAGLPDDHHGRGVLRDGWASSRVDSQRLMLKLKSG